MTREAARDDARDDGATPARARATNFAVISSPRSVIDRWDRGWMHQQRGASRASCGLGTQQTARTVTVTGTITFRCG